MAGVLQVSTPLSFDTATTNIIELGKPALITISNVINGIEASISQYCSGTHNSKDDSKCESRLSLATVSVLGKRTGHKSCSDVTVTSLGDGVQLVKFEPKISDDYSLRVCYKGQNIQGSPFTIKAIEKEALDGHWSSRPSQVISTGEPVNLIIPEDIFGSQDCDIKERGRKLQISVRNSLGVCESSDRHLPHLKSIAISFTPDVESSYFIKAILSDSTNKTSPSKMFVLQANSPDDETNYCFIDEKDVHIFKKPQNFRCNSPVRFRIHTVTQKNVYRESDKLDVFCQGPARAVVKIISDHSSPASIEICEVTPSAPGKYRIDILWGGKPIKENPFFLNFKPPLRRIRGGGLNLEHESLCVGIPHRFRLTCSTLGQGELKLSSNPPSAADTNVKQIQANDKKELYYQCQIIPRQVGHHELWIKYNGHHIEESPLKVHFKPRGDATKCAMVSSSNFHQAGGHVCFQISTSGAGEGVLVATVEEVAKKHMYLRGGTSRSKTTVPRAIRD